ncbi:MAG: polyphenol oxidase family protein, partial [Psychrobacter sp.]|nr:polyphenol oxidase family protein [Psychrobacter sp.]
MTLNHISKLANQAKGRGIKEGGIEELSVKRSCNEIIGNHAPASLKLMDIAKIFVSSDDLIVAQTYCSFGDNDNDDRDKANRDKATQELADRLPSYGDFNLGLHVGDQPSQVHRRRGQLLAALNAHIQQNTHQASSITQLHWVNQVHGNHVIDVDAQPLSLSAQDADAMISQSAQCALAIMTADCVPIVLYQPASGQIGAIHAGWQGLANGIIAATVKRFNPSMPIYAWIGACISQANYQVSTEVASKLVESCLSLG